MCYYINNYRFRVIMEVYFMYLLIGELFGVCYKVELWYIDSIIIVFF